MGTSLIRKKEKNIRNSEVSIFFCSKLFEINLPPHWLWLTVTDKLIDKRNCIGRRISYQHSQISFTFLLFFFCLTTLTKKCSTVTSTENIPTISFARGKISTWKKDAWDITLNCIWFWGSSSRDLESVESLLHWYYSHVHSDLEWL